MKKIPPNTYTASQRSASPAKNIGRLTRNSQSLSHHVAKAHRADDLRHKSRNTVQRDVCGKLNRARGVHTPVGEGLDDLGPAERLFFVKVAFVEVVSFGSEHLLIGRQEPSLGEGVGYPKVCQGGEAQCQRAFNDV